METQAMQSSWLSVCPQGVVSEPFERAGNLIRALFHT
jgi:hypothetical protein